jgi:uncharacterized protein (TIGR00730 family)
MTKLTSLCVYCGARAGTDPAHRAAAERLGALLGQNRIKLIFGAGSIGLMGVVADSALAAGGEVIGVIPHHLNRVELAHDRLTEIHIVNSMHERKQRMFELADAFAVLPGGLGTLDETIEIVTWRQLRLHHMPVILIDHNGYWKPLIDLVDHVVAQGFADPSVTELFTVVSSVDDIIPLIEALPRVEESARAEYL